MSGFKLKPDQIGKNSYLVKCSALSDEINIDNNRQKFYYACNER